MTDDASQPITVQAQVRRANATDLVHPIGGWGSFFVPADLTPKDEVNVPRRIIWRELENGRVGSSKEASRVHEVSGAGIKDSSRFSLRRIFHWSPGQHRHPDHIRPQVRARDFLEDFLLDFGGPPKANPSMGINQKEEADFACVPIERGPQRLEVARKPGNGWMVGLRCAARQGQRQESRNRRPLAHCLTPL